MEKRAKRISVKMKQPNPLFEKWLREWYEEAKQRDSKLQYTYNKALKSLQKFPLPLKTGKECKILDGFGDKLCQMLDEKLKNPHVDPTVNSYNPTVTVANNKTSPKKKDNQIGSQIPKKKAKTKSPIKEYIPVFRSGPYAIIMTLYKQSSQANYPGYLTKKDIIRHGQHLCDESLAKAPPGTFYTAWSSVKTLLTKQLVTKVGNPAKFSLTPSGFALGQKLSSQESSSSNIASNLPSTIDISTSESEDEDQVNKENSPIKDPYNIPSTSQSSLSQVTSSVRSLSCKATSSSSIETNHETVFFPPESFDIILLIDTQETTGKVNIMYDTTLAQFANLNVAYEVRHLNVGDFLWICRDKNSKTELVLPYIVERKRMDDFAASIKDRRYHEQKLRLRNCGVQNVIYLLEDHGDNSRVGLPMANLQQAAINTVLHDEFFVKHTHNLQDTIMYLTTMTTILKTHYSGKTLMSCPKTNLEKSSLNDDLIPLMIFTEFNAKGVKRRKFTVRQQFLRTLVKLKGVSIEKAVTIVSKYPTPKLLLEEYGKLSESQGEKLLSEISSEKGSKKISLPVSKTIHQFFTKSRF